jgi:peroxiredoxin
MPSFVLPDDTGRLVSLEEVLQKGPIALSFHRGTGAPTAASTPTRWSRHNRRCPDRRQFASELRAGAKAPFPILLDMDNGYAMSLNLAICVGEEMKRMMAESGWDLPAYQGNDAWMLPIPATFIVATDGRITARFVDPDYRKRMAIEDMLDALKAAH